MDYPQQPQRRRGLPISGRLVMIAVGLIPVVMFMMTSCTKGPFGRNQFRAINEQQEDQLGLQAFQQVISEEKAKGNLLPKNAEIVRQVEEITTNLTQAAKRPEVCEEFMLPVDQFKWAVEVIDSPEANAFCLPGGKMVVYTGILPIAQTDAALAAVIGHEISHALAHHGAERMAHEEIKNKGVAGIGMGLGDMDPGQQQMILSAIGMAAKFGMMPYSQKHELEADRMGLVLMAAAGYDPREAVRFWERMQERTGEAKVPQFMSTHPDHGTRIAELRGFQEAVSKYPVTRKTQPLDWQGSGRAAPRAKMGF